MKLNRPYIAAATIVVALLGAALAGVVAHASASKTTTITVKEKEYRLTLSTKKGAVGPTRFVVKNVGKLAHAFAISGPGVKTKKTKTIQPGTSATLLVTLKSGSYSVWCPMPGHAALGMKATIAVAAAGGGGTPAGGGSGTTTSAGGGGGAWG
jgi:plastocyanin